MAGGIESALSRGEAEIESTCPSSGKGLTAVDLGAGFGTHAIPLARRGYFVTAIDGSEILLSVLEGHATDLPIRTVNDDLLSFGQYVNSEVDLILCMGDTLTHLPDLESVNQLFASARQHMCSGASLVLTFRDYSSPLRAEERFVLVKSDDARILTCCLEYSASHVTVHDILHERQNSSWALQVSAYRKLRLSPEWVSMKLKSHGFTVRVESRPAGMVRFIAKCVYPHRGA